MTQTVSVSYTYSALYSSYVALRSYRQVSSLHSATSIRIASLHHSTLVTVHGGPRARAQPCQRLAPPAPDLQFSRASSYAYCYVQLCRVSLRTKLLT